MLFLASQSPRRQELLTQVGVSFSVLSLEVPEQQAPGETADDYVRRVARDKALAGWERVRGQHPAARVLGADTEVVLDGIVFGKPRDADEAAFMLARLQGRCHQVLSGVCLVENGSVRQDLCATQVHVAPLSTADIQAYLRQGEFQGKAGAYAIQGRAAAFIARIEGSYSGVMGLPLFETLRLLGTTAGGGHGADID